MTGYQILCTILVTVIAVATAISLTVERFRFTSKAAVGFGLVFSLIGLTLAALREGDFFGVLVFEKATGVGRAYILGLGVTVGALVRLAISWGRGER